MWGGTGFEPFPNIPALVMLAVTALFVGGRLLALVAATSPGVA